MISNTIMTVDKYVTHASKNIKSDEKHTFNSSYLVPTMLKGI